MPSVMSNLSDDLKYQALAYHRLPKPGKLEIAAGIDCMVMLVCGEDRLREAVLSRRTGAPKTYSWARRPRS